MSMTTATPTVTYRFMPFEQYSKPINSCLRSETIFRKRETAAVHGRHRTAGRTRIAIKIAAWYVFPPIFGRRMEVFINDFGVFDAEPFPHGFHRHFNSTSEGCSTRL
jgi:hypothetical protein